jgi:nitroimidazol reductase NimA-like FMN-containing flavoprotein (pyridoxamine 5'-phosphate oxidase superfamily)
MTDATKKPVSQLKLTAAQRLEERMRAELSVLIRGRMSLLNETSETLAVKIKRSHKWVKKRLDNVKPLGVKAAARMLSAMGATDIDVVAQGPGPLEGTQA